MGDYGYIVHKKSAIHKELRAAFREIAKRHQYGGIITMYKEKNVYNLFVNVGEEAESPRTCARMRSSRVFLGRARACKPRSAARWRRCCSRSGRA